MPASSFCRQSLGFKRTKYLLHDGTYLFGPCAEVFLCLLKTAFCFTLPGLLAFKPLYPHRKPFRSKEATLPKSMELLQYL